MSFKDVASQPNSDSMEVTFNFNLPSKSVIDSMYLWIDNEPQPAALKEKWSAVSAYWQVVGRRWDPALLTKWNGDAYSLRVFPFSYRQERKVRICYTTPLTVAGGDIVFRYPLDMASGTMVPVSSLSGTITIDRPGDQVSCNVQEDITVVTESGNEAGVSTVTFSASDIIPEKQLILTLADPQLRETGMSTCFSKAADGDLSFLSVLEPATATGAVNSRPKNILILWNMVSKYAYYEDYYAGTSGTIVAYNYYEYYIDRMLQGINALLSNYMQTGDRFNLVFNDGSIKRIYPAQTAYSPGMQSDV